MSPESAGQTPPAGWYPDNSVDAPAGQQRYWDGSAWTEHTTSAPTEPADQAAVQQAPRDGLGLAAFSLGVIGSILAFTSPLIFGILGIVGMILGFLGRDRAKRGEATNGRTALWGIILSALAVVISVIAVARQFVDLSEESVGTGDTLAADLEVGDCLANQNESEAVIVGVDTVPCSEPHGAEVYAVVTLPEGDFPGDEAIVTQTEDVCVAQFEDFVGLPYAESVLEFSYLYPSEESWNVGDRRVTCSVVDLAGDTTGTLANANR
jgi:Septum formation/Protein of unknown function (DUF2510)